MTTTSNCAKKQLLVWLTGLSGAGKSTIARLLESQLRSKGVSSYLLDADEVRCGLNNDLGFSPEDRKENVRRLSEVAKLIHCAGTRVVIVAAISPYRSDRLVARQLFPSGSFFEVYVRIPIEEAEARDIKGLYALSRSGVLRDFTGIDAPYEEPTHPEVIIDVPTTSPHEAASRILIHIEQASPTF